MRIPNWISNSLNGLTGEVDVNGDSRVDNNDTAPANATVLDTFVALHSVPGGTAGATANGFDDRSPFDSRKALYVVGDPAPTGQIYLRPIVNIAKDRIVGCSIIATNSEAAGGPNNDGILATRVVDVDL